MADLEEPRSHLSLLLLILAVPVLASVVVFQIDEFEAAVMPSEYTPHAITVANHHSGVARAMEKIGEGSLPGPEDIAYDAEAEVVYTGCVDGWIKTVKVGEKVTPTVHNWVFVGGRPLGVAFGPDRRLYVANADKGLMVIDSDGNVKLLTDEAEGVKFALTDSVEVASDGMVYFTDASYKYNLATHMMDIFEGRPHGRLLRFDPNTNHTQVLLRDLYFANGVALSPKQDFLVYCETLLRRCRRYHIHGDNIGKVDDFIDKLPGFPDNIRYDGNDRYWIGIASEETSLLSLAFKYPILRKIIAVIEKHVKTANTLKNGGVLEVNLEGHAVSLYTDPTFHGITGGFKIGKHLYVGHLVKSYFGRLDLAAFQTHSK